MQKIASAILGVLVSLCLPIGIASADPVHWSYTSTVAPVDVFTDLMPGSGATGHGENVAAHTASGPSRVGAFSPILGWGAGRG
jgi:hypothetical protein